MKNSPLKEVKHLGKESSKICSGQQLSLFGDSFNVDKAQGTAEETGFRSLKEDFSSKEQADETAKETFFSSREESFDNETSLRDAKEQVECNHFDSQQAECNHFDEEFPNETSENYIFEDKNTERRRKRHKAKQDLSEATTKSVKNAESILSEEIMGRHKFFRLSLVNEQEFRNEWKICTPITSVCTSLSDLDDAKGVHKEEIEEFLTQLKDFFETTMPHFGVHNKEDINWFTMFRIMIPHDLSEEKYKEFIKGFLKKTPYEEGMPFILAIKKQKHGLFLMLFICHRKYYSEETSLAVQIAKKDQFYSKKTGRACKESDPDAVLRCKAGTVTRSINTHFGKKKSFFRSISTFIEMRKEIIDYMENFFNENECTENNRVLLGKYEGLVLKSCKKSARKMCASYNSIFNKMEVKLTSLYSIAQTYRSNFLSAGFDAIISEMRSLQSQDLCIPYPGFGSYIPGHLSVAYEGDKCILKLNLEMMQEKLSILYEKLCSFVADIISKIPVFKDHS